MQNSFLFLAIVIHAVAVFEAASDLASVPQTKERPSQGTAVDAKPLSHLTMGEHAVRWLQKILPPDAIQGRRLSEFGKTLGKIAQEVDAKNKRGVSIGNVLVDAPESVWEDAEDILSRARQQFLDAVSEFHRLRKEVWDNDALAQSEKQHWSTLIRRTFGQVVMKNSQMASRRLVMFKEKPRLRQFAGFSEISMSDFTSKVESISGSQDVHSGSQDVHSGSQDVRSEFGETMLGIKAHDIESKNKRGVSIGNVLVDAPDHVWEDAEDILTRALHEFLGARSELGTLKQEVNKKLQKEVGSNNHAFVAQRKELDKLIMTSFGQVIAKNARLAQRTLRMVKLNAGPKPFAGFSEVAMSDFTSKMESWDWTLGLQEVGAIQKLDVPDKKLVFSETCLLSVAAGFAFVALVAVLRPWKRWNSWVGSVKDDQLVSLDPDDSFDD